MFTKESNSAAELDRENQEELVMVICITTAILLQLDLVLTVVYREVSESVVIDFESAIRDRS